MFPSARQSSNLSSNLFNIYYLWLAQFIIGWCFLSFTWNVLIFLFSRGQHKMNTKFHVQRQVKSKVHYLCRCRLAASNYPGSQPAWDESLKLAITTYRCIIFVYSKENTIKCEYTLYYINAAMSTLINFQDIFQVWHFL